LARTKSIDPGLGFTQVPQFDLIIIGGTARVVSGMKTCPPDTTVVTFQNVP
jgi:hypothetical protein